METGINTLQKMCKIYNVNLTVSSIAWIVIYSSVWLWPTASCSAQSFDRTGCVQLSQKVVQCLSFPFLLYSFRFVVDLLWTCCIACCTTNPQQIK